MACTLRVVVLLRFQRPEKCQQTQAAKSKRYRDQPDQHCHGYFNRMALSETEIDDSDIAAAAASGVASPISANGTAMRL